MGRMISYDVYIFAFLISLGVFALGVFLGSLLDAHHIETFSEELSNVNERMNTIILMGQLENDSSLCELYKEEFEDVSEAMERVGYKLWFMEEERGVSDVSLKKKYFLLETEAMYLARIMNERCDTNYKIVMYFYSNSNCSSCRSQGDTLFLVTKDTGIRVYSFDGDLGSGVVEILKKKYGIRTYPTIVIDGEVYEGYLSAEELQRLLH
ncbi:MAG: DsbA family protein [Candidatus Asgardarchaeia archaeon]